MIYFKKNKLETSSPQKKVRDSFEPDEVLDPLMSQENSNKYYDKRLINICQVPQMPYLERNLKSGKWQPTKEAVNLVKSGKLHIEKHGQRYSMVNAMEEHTTLTVPEHPVEVEQIQVEQFMKQPTNFGPEEKMTFIDKNIRSLLLDYCEPYVKTAYYKELFGEEKDDLTDDEIRKLTKSANFFDLLGVLDDKTLRDFAKDSGIPISSDNERQKNLIVEGIKRLQQKEEIEQLNEQQRVSQNKTEFEPLYFGDITENGEVNVYTKEQYFEKFGEEPSENDRLDDEQVEKWNFEEYIHSEEFVSKFGDWEKAARLKKLENSPTIEKDGKVIQAFRSNSIYTSDYPK